MPKTPLDQRDDYDYILIDCPLSLGLLTNNALNSAIIAWCPGKQEYFATEGLAVSKYG